MAKLGGAVVFCCGCVLFAFLAGRQPAVAAETFDGVVFRLVNEAINGNYSVPGDPRVGPALIRLLFHDCWLTGCDGSVLLSSTPTDGNNTERTAASNIGLGGFDLINKIKAEINNTANDASCADILAFAARDAAGILSGGAISYAVATGRRDGANSSAAAANAALPGSTFKFTQLAASFAARGMGSGDLVALSGAHSVGVCHSSSFDDRLDPAKSAGEINATYQVALIRDVAEKKQLQGNQDPIEMNNIRDMNSSFQSASLYDATGVNPSKGVLDNSYYTANLQNMVLLRSDWALTTDGVARNKMQEYKKNATKWYEDFGAAMARLSKLLPPEGQYLEDKRKNCSVTNLSFMNSNGY
ncbi:hypothetical protein ACP4OV_015913 [Aristida adscensionis]